MRSFRQLGCVLHIWNDAICAHICLKRLGIYETRGVSRSIKIGILLWIPIATRKYSTSSSVRQIKSGVPQGRIIGAVLLLTSTQFWITFNFNQCLKSVLIIGNNVLFVAYTDDVAVFLYGPYSDDIIWHPNNSVLSLSHRDNLMTEALSFKIKN